MRRPLGFACEGAALVGTLDEGTGPRGLLIVTGGGETRFGPHRLFARLATALAASGHPVFRFDRRGVGDSEGEDGGYAASGPDIAAALAAFRAACPAMTTVAGFGLCDGATALALHGGGLDALVLANPWLVEPAGDLPPAAAIRHRYRERLTSVAAWRRALSGGIDYRRAMRGLAAIGGRGEDRTLGTRVAAALSGRDARLVIASGDATARSAMPFLAGLLPVTTIDTASHSFAGPEAFTALVEALAAALDGGLVAEEGLEPPTPGL